MDAKGSILLWGLFLSVALAAGGIAAQEDATVTGVEASGEGVVDADSGDGTTYLWRSEPVAIEVTLEVPDRAETYEVCVTTAVENETGSLACESRTLSGDGQVPLEVAEWPENATDGNELRLRVVRNVENGSEVVADVHLPILVIDRDGDQDGDGLSNRDEVERGTNISNADTDGDTVSDGEEVNTHETDPLATDTDDDGLDDNVEINTYGTNPTEADTDGDGLPDGAEVNDHQTDPTEADTDEDGLDDGVEIERHGTNPNRADTDGDGLDDGTEVNVHETDPTSVDTDEDGLDDGTEVNEHGTNPRESDTDGDGLDDGAEVNVHGTDPNSVDTDGDGTPDPEEISGGGDPNEGQGGAFGDLPTEAAIGGVGLVLLVLAVAAARRGMARRAPPADETPDDRDGAATDPVPTKEAMSDEDRVLDIVESNGGRIRQVEIVDRTDWSKSKTSRLLSRMAEEGQIEKVDIGRENLIALPGEIPPGVRGGPDTEED